MPLRFALIGACAFAFALLPVGWGCKEPPSHSAVLVPDSVLVDSLQAALQRRDGSTGSPSDPAVLDRWADRLLTVADSASSRHPDSARGLLRTSLRAGRALGDSAHVGQCLTGIGRTYAAQSRYDAALTRYRRALSLHRELGRPAPVARTLSAAGDALQRQGRYEAALERYREALSMHRERDAPRGVAQALNDVGALHERQARYEKALRSYRQSLSIYRERGDRRGIARTLGNLGNVHQIKGRYEEARGRLREALEISRTLGDRRVVARTLNDVGVVHYRQGHYAEALSRFREALSIYRDLGDRREVTGALNRVGAAYYIQGRYEEALARYRTALAVNRSRGNEDGIARNLNNIGIVRRHQGRYESARRNFREALAIHRELGDRRDEAINLSNLGEVLRLQGRHEEALARYRRALSINRRLGARESIASNLNNMGKVYHRQEHHEKALQHYGEALALRRTLGSHRRATSLRMIGDVLLDRGRVAAATDTLGRAVRLAEELRLNVTSPKARRSLLSTQISTYRALTSAYVRSNRPGAALRSVEQARARLLADQLAGTVHSDTTFSVPSPHLLRRTLGPGEAALLYANAGERRPLTVLVATRDTAYARELPVSTVRTRVERAYSAELRRLRRKEGPLTAALGRGRGASGRETPSLAEMIRLYRYFVIREGTGDSVQNNLATRLYSLLLEPIAETVREADELTIVPTGTLGYLPFETLRGPAGTYLIEHAHVRYAQSLTVLRQLQGRSYGDSGRSLLALGGAAYGTASPSGEAPLLADARGDSAIRSEERAASLYRSAERRLERGRSPGPTYAELGYDGWPALYGTKLEVQKLKRAVGTGTTLLTGSDASEARVRTMSASGELTRYRRIHFATHGIAVPEAPELSALVLSQVGASDSLATRDGYLTMREIADLRIQADVAVLSACRTGLGRIVAGEGVVNLSHAFLRAGANATLVSQWRVLDWSTQQFMTSVYRRTQGTDTTFAEAVTQVKREFIAGTFGERNTDPLRWAPFVYYGREERPERER